MQVQLIIILFCIIALLGHLIFRNIVNIYFKSLLRLKKSIAHSFFKISWIVLLIVASIPASLLAQQTLTNNFEVNFVDIAASSPNPWESEYQDYKIPDDPITEYIHFEVRGADGGSAKSGSGTTAGGDGAVIEFDIKIGDGPNEIPPGTTLRFMVGMWGQGHTVGAGHFAVGGGGGGTGIILRNNISTGPFRKILAIAGGGGGAMRSSTWGSAPGLGANAGTSGDDGEGVFGLDGGENGYYNYYDGDDQGGSGGGWYDGGLHRSGERGITGLHGDGGIGTYGGNGGWGCGGGGGGASSDGSTYGAGGGGGYSGGGGSGDISIPVAGGGGGSYLADDYPFNTSKTSGGASFPTELGIVYYQFYCSARFAETVTVTNDLFCTSLEDIQLAVETPQWWCDEVSYKRADTGETNTTGTFTGLSAGENYTFYLYYGDDLVDSLTHSVDNVIDDEAPTIVCNGDLEFDIRETPNPVINLADIGSASDNCGLLGFTIWGYGDSRSFSCDDLGDHTIALAAVDSIGLLSYCTFTVSINNGYPIGSGVHPLTVELDANGTVTVSDDELVIIDEDIGSCFTYDEVVANYSIPTEFENLDCDDVGTHLVLLDELDDNFPDIYLELTVEDNVSTQASVDDITLVLNSSGVAPLDNSDLLFSVSDNCLSDAEIIANYSLPADAQLFDCTDVGTSIIFLDRVDESFPAVPLQVTVISADLIFDPVDAEYCPDIPFNLTNLEDNITLGEGTFTYSKSVERLYIPNQSDNTVSVIDLETNSVISTIDVGTEPVGAAVSPDGQEVYVANSGSNSVSVISVATNSVVHTISGMGDVPYSIAFNSDGSRAYVTHWSFLGEVSIINTATRSVLNTVNVDLYPAAVVVSPDDSKVYVACEESHTVCIINTSNNSFTSIGVERWPAGIDLSADGTKLYVACKGNFDSPFWGAIDIMDISTNQVETTIDTEIQRPGDLAVSPLGTFYVGHAQDGGYFSKIDPGNGNQLTLVEIDEDLYNTYEGADLNEDGSVLYLSDAGQDKVTLVNTSTNAVIMDIPVGDRPQGQGHFYVKTEIAIENPTAYHPANGEVINVAFDGGDGCTATTTITLNLIGADVTPPVALCIPDTTIYVGYDYSPILDIATIDAGSYEVGSCDSIISLSLSEEVLFCLDIDTPRDYILTVTDLAGNSNTCTTTITLADTLGPEVVACNDISVDLATDGTYTLSDDDLVTAFEIQTVCINVNYYNTSEVQFDFDCEDVGQEIPMTISALDYHGNYSEACDFTVTVNDPLEACPRDVLVSAKAILAGPYDSASGLMNDDLRTLDLIPNTDPYGSDGGTVDASVLAISGNNAIVDWVLIELRSASDNTEILHSRAALLQRDGDVVDTDGVSPVTFAEVGADNYFVALRHRNHLGLLTLSARGLSDIPTTIDFSTSTETVYGTDARVELETNVWGLYSADTDGSGGVNATDRSTTWNDRNTSGYLDSDCNMDGYTNASDRSSTWNNRNIGGTLPE